MCLFDELKVCLKNLGLELATGVKDTVLSGFGFHPYPTLLLDARPVRVSVSIPPCGRLVEASFDLVQRVKLVLLVLSDAASNHRSIKLNQDRSFRTEGHFCQEYVDLGNTPISNYTRDQGWGMGSQVGAIPSIIGGHHIQLSHVGMVFEVNEQTIPCWKRWYHHVRREQVFVWFPACLLGIALPAMLPVQFLPRGFVVENQWLSSVMTANAIRDHAGARWGHFFWFMIILCGFLVMAVSIGPATDGFLRRWVDVFWTASRRLRSLDPRNIRYIYFAMLVAYIVLSVVMLCIGKPPHCF